MKEKDKGKGLERKMIHLERLILYRDIEENPMIKKVKELLGLVGQETCDEKERDPLFYEICSDLMGEAEKYHWENNLWQHFVIGLIAQAENPFSRACAWSGGKGMGDSVVGFAVHDLSLLLELFHFDFRSLGSWVPEEIVGALEHFTPGFSENGIPVNPHYREALASLRNCFQQNLDPQELVYCLSAFYGTFGYGEMGLFSSFRWETGKGLVGIPYPDPVTLNDLIGYEIQKQIIIGNTEAFLTGRKANNLLLYGERGTGKSSTIKALVNRYCSRGLRLLEVDKNQLNHLLEMMRHVRKYPQRFLVFIDDLSFESSETEYKYLKYILEGGMEILPDNVVIYATSNRRHLVQETWHDREGGGEVRISDSIAEKLSLADRFGVTVTYTSPDQEEYLKIVFGLAEKKGISMPAAELRERALQWERWHNGRSGRTAVQFINSLLA